MSTPHSLCCILAAEISFNMGILRRVGTKVFLLAACLGCAGSAYAACTGPQALVAQLRAHPTADNAVTLGSWYASHQQFDCAIEVFRSGLKHDPKSAQLHYLTGLALVAEKRPDEAQTELEQSARLDPEVLKPHIVLATVYEETGKRAEAEDQWRKALAIDPKSEDALEGLANDLMASQDYSGVVQLLHDAPRTEKLTIPLARALGLLNYLDESGNVLLEAMKAQPDSLPLAEAMVVVLVKQTKYQEAINLLQYMVKKHPGSEDAEMQLFRLLVLTNHINLARPIGPKLLAARPHDAEVLYLNGIVERSVGDFAQAKTYLEQAVALDPNFFNSRFNLGMVDVFLKDWQGAKENLEKAIALGAPQPEVHFELAKALRGMGDAPGAMQEIQLYQKLKKADDDATQAALSAGQGDRDMDAGKIDEALRHYRDAVQAKPDSAAYHYKLAVALHRSGDTAGEREQLDQAIKIDPKMAGAHNALGFLLSRSGDADGAVQHFREAVDAAPEWPEAWINLAAELAVQGHFEEARQAVAKALQLDPANTQAKELSDQLAHDPAAQQAGP
jgi:tetratricopeptide (TPR) repeat protein